MVKVRRRGIYAPLTTNGRLLVQGILASCYSAVKDQTIQSTFFDLMAKIHKQFYGISSWMAEKTVGFRFFEDIQKLGTFSDRVTLRIAIVHRDTVNDTLLNSELFIFYCYFCFKTSERNK